MKKILLLILVVALVAGAVGVLRNGIPENILFAGGSGSASSGSGGGNTIKRRQATKKFGGQIIRSYDFDDDQDPGFIRALDYGELTFSDGKLHYNNLSSGVSGNSYFAFNYGDPVSANVVYNPNLADFDYFSAEFDMDFSAATPDLYISFLCRTGSGASASSGMIAIKNENGSLLCFAGDGSYSRKVELGDHAHFSLFVMPEDDPEYSVCLVYVDGEYVGYCYGIKSGAVTANGLRVGCSSNYYPEGNESFSMDNVLLAVFGDGSGRYSGDLADLFFDPETPLSECADSVLGGAIR